MKNNQKGITLIALVVTIIVLLILAGVSIAMLTGQNGILNRASESSVVNAIGEGKDMVALTVAECTSDFYDWKYNGATNADINTAKTDAGENPTDDAILEKYIIKKVNALGETVSGVKITVDTDTSTMKVTSTKDGSYYSSISFTGNVLSGSWSDHFGS